MERLNHPLKGISFAVIAVFVLSVQDALVKWLATDFTIVQILFVRSVVMLFPVFFMLQRRHGLIGLHTHRPFGHLLRLIFNLAAFMAFFGGLSRLPLADAMALMMTSPIIMAVLSGPLLGEYAHGKAWVAVLIGFLGVLVMVGPQGENADLLGAVSILAGSVAYTLLMIQTRHLSSTESNESMVFFSAIGIALITACIVPLYWQTPTVGNAVLLVLVGFVSALGHTLLVQAYRFAPIYLLGPLDYTALVWAVLIGFLVWGDIPSGSMLLGAALIVGCGLYLYLREQR
jgi:drug/metabolite transporter (DMT)-like permease